MFLSACASSSPTQCLVIVRFNLEVTGSEVVPEQTDQPSYLRAFAQEEKTCSGLARWQGVFVFVCLSQSICRRRIKDVLMSGTVARGGAMSVCFLACVSNSPTQCLICRGRIKNVLMSGTVARGGARAALSPLRMDSCIADPQQELLIVFKERNLR